MTRRRRRRARAQLKRYSHPKTKLKLKLPFIQESAITPSIPVIRDMIQIRTTLRRYSNEDHTDLVCRAEKLGNVKKV